jgi:hypothetical protein
MLIKGCMNQLYGESSNDLRMVVDMEMALTETQRKAAISTPYQPRQDANKLENWLAMQPQRHAWHKRRLVQRRRVGCVTVSRPLNNWWLNRKQHPSILDTFGSLVTEIHKTSLLPNIRDGAINARLGLTQGSMSYVRYTQLFNDVLRKSRQPLPDDLHCIRFINGLANF